MAQPGYRELMNAQRTLKDETRSAISNKYSETYSKKREILTSNIFSSVALHVLRALEVISSFLSFFYKTTLGIIFLSFLFFGFLKAGAVLLLCFILWLSLTRISNILIARQENIHKDAISALNNNFREFERDAEKNLVEQITLMHEEYNGYPPDWSERRLKVFQRDEYFCQSCFCKFPASQLHAHHILEIAYGGTNELDNLTTMCASCHGKEHA